jgi:hypothetical protein
VPGLSGPFFFEKDTSLGSVPVHIYMSGHVDFRWDISSILFSILSGGRIGRDSLEKWCVFSLFLCFIHPFSLSLLQLVNDTKIILILMSLTRSMDEIDDFLLLRPPLLFLHPFV